MRTKKMTTTQTQNPLVHPGIDGIRESAEYNQVKDELRNNAIESMVELEQEFDAQFYAALEQIAAEKTGLEAAPVDVDDDALEATREFAEEIGADGKAGGYALYECVSDATMAIECYDNGEVLRTITSHYYSN